MLIYHDVEHGYDESCALANAYLHRVQSEVCCADLGIDVVAKLLAVLVSSRCADDIDATAANLRRIAEETITDMRSGKLVMKRRLAS